MRMARFLLVALLLPAPASAHPHVWISGGAHFGLDAEGRLARLHVVWIYDSFASLYIVNALELDKDGDQSLNAAEKARLLADQTTWPEEFAGDSALHVGGERWTLGGPENADARLLPSGQVEVRFDRRLDPPIRPDAATGAAVAKVYDPTFYYAYEVTEPPRILGSDPQGCQVEHRPFDADSPALQALQVELSALDRTETPEQQDVGALFADELRLTCG